MRPASSGANRARIRSFNRSTFPSPIAASFGLMVDPVCAIRQNVSKSSKVRWIVMSRVSMSTSPAPAHRARSASIRDASTLGG